MKKRKGRHKVTAKRDGKVSKSKAARGRPKAGNGMLDEHSPPLQDTFIKDIFGIWDRCHCTAHLG